MVTHLKKNPCKGVFKIKNMFMARIIILYFLYINIFGMNIFVVLKLKEITIDPNILLFIISSLLNE